MAELPSVLLVEDNETERELLGFPESSRKKLSQKRVAQGETRRSPEQCREPIAGIPPEKPVLDGV